MALKVVGSGLGRTGTKSLQSALNMLGFGPCHHMVEVFAHPETMPLWIAAGQGRPDWDTIFANYHSMVDYPGAPYWRKLAAYYPHAKVLHSVRDPDQWFDSTQATIFSPQMQARGQSGPMADFFNSFLGPARAHLSDRAYMVEHFRQHTRDVIAAIPKERLLVYEVGQGWEPLCKFLDVAVPEAPFPSVNSRGEFVQRMRDNASPPGSAAP